MKIGITCYPTYGGSGALATELGIALAARDHEVHFITYKQPFRLPSFLPGVYFHEVDVGRYPLFEYPPYDLALAVRMHEVVTSHSLDLLHVHYAIPHATSAWIAREMLREAGHDIRIVTTLHGTDITIVGQDPSFHSITRFSIERSDRITAVSQYLRAETIRAFGCAGCDVQVIPNFVDPEIYDRDRYQTSLSERVGHGRRIMMHISNFRPVKRVRDVVDVFARVHWLDGPPDDEWRGVLFANEVLDALPTPRFVVRGGEVYEEHVALSADGTPIRVDQPADALLRAAVRHVEQSLGAPLPEGYRSELLPQLPYWIQAVGGLLADGAMLFVDYGYPRAEYYLPERRDGTLVCHRRHVANTDPFALPGLQDITAFVDFTALAEAGVGAGFDFVGTGCQFAAGWNSSIRLMPLPPAGPSGSRRHS